MKYLVSILAIAFLAACATTTPTVQTGPDAEISFDGLHRVDNTYMRKAWIKPNLSLAGYTKILVNNAGVEYRDVRPASRVTSVNSSRSEFPLDEKQRARFESLVQEVFTEELGKSKYFTLTDKPGPDVLILTGGFLDVVSAVPPEGVGRRDIFITRIGQATLVLELQDSQSGETLVRAIDRRAIQPVQAQRAFTGTTVQEVRRQLRRWGSRLTEALDGLHEGQP
jgi:hypothetical protein